MAISINLAWITFVVLSTARIAAALMFTPVLGYASLPTPIRALLVLGLSAAVAATVPIPHAESVRTLLDLLLAAVAEVTLGAAMAFGIAAVFAAFSVGGKLLDYQMGFGIASLFDPTTKTQSSLNGTFLSMLGAAAFLAVDAHHTVIKALAYSLTAVPIGHVGTLHGDLLVAQFGLMFSFGFMLVAPPVVVLMLVDLGTGVASRLMPQVSAYFVFLPVKIFVGIVTTALSLRYMQPLILNMFSTAFEYWQRLLAGA